MTHPEPHPWTPACCRLHDRPRSLLSSRRDVLAALGALGITIAAPAFAREGVDVGPPSRLSGLVSASQIEQQAAQQYRSLQQQATQKGALLPATHPQVVRLRAIAARLIPHTHEWNARARSWRWEVNVLNSPSINAFCMPGGKIAFFTGILQKLQLTDDEVAMIMGHEMAHALREHAREQIGKRAATRGAIEVGAALFGLGDLGRLAAGAGGQLLTLKFGRDDETEADLIGLELAARAGYDPRAAVSLWQKMAQANQRGNLEFLSTHPSGGSRIAILEQNIPKVAGLYQRASKPPVRHAPMA